MSGCDSTSPFRIEQAERSFFDPRPGNPASDESEGRWGPFPEVEWVASPSSEPQRPASEDRSGGEALPVLSNTGNENSRGLGRGVVACGGIDWLEFSVEGSVGGEEYRRLCLQLEEAKTLAVMDRKVSRFVDVWGATLKVLPFSRMWGTTKLEYFVEFDGIQIGLGRPDGRGDYVAKVSITGLRLTRDGGDARPSFEQAKRVLATMGVEVSRCVLYRIDLCLDVPGMKVDPYCESIAMQRTITRIKSKAHLHKNAAGEWTGCSTGNREGVYLNIYDKTVQLADNPGVESEAKLQWLQERWGGEFDHVTRVEFQIRGVWLRNRWENVSDVEQVLDSVPTISHFLVSRFFRIVSGDVDRENNNQSKARTSVLWDLVCRGFADVFGKADDLARKAPAAFSVAKRMEHARRQMVAAAKRFAACLGPDGAGSKSRILTAVVNTISSEWEDTKVLADLRRVWSCWGSLGVGELRWEGSPMARWKLEDSFVPF